MLQKFKTFCPVHLLRSKHFERIQNIFGRIQIFWTGLKIFEHIYFFKFFPFLVISDHIQIFRTCQKIFQHVEIFWTMFKNF